jgi:septum formation protein
MLGLPFTSMPSSIEEDNPEGLAPEALAEDLAKRKIARIVEKLNGRVPLWICAADTLLSVDGDEIGKPADRDEAGRILKRLAGRQHEVITAVALFNGRSKTTECVSVKSRVTIAPLSEETLEWYLETGEWQGAAGAYKIQGLGACIVKEIAGSYSAIVGLPLHEFYDMLLNNGYFHRV